MRSTAHLQLEAFRISPLAGCYPDSHNHLLADIMRATLLAMLFALGLLGCSKESVTSVQGDTRQLSDEEFTKRLVGVWFQSITNRQGVRVFGDATYRADGTVTWDGTFISQTRTQQFLDHGVWRVERGYLCTTVTNSAVNQFALHKEYRDELISATESEFAYRTSGGSVESRLRKY